MNSVTVGEEKLPANATRVSTEISAVCVLLVTVLVFLYHAQFSKSDYLLSDSADYVRAARAPLKGTYFNTDSLSPMQLFALRNDPVFRSHPWDYLYVRDDNSALRHFHSPFSFYAMHAVSKISPHDKNQRVVSSLVTAATCAAIVAGLIAFDVPLVLAILLALLAGVQSRYTEVSINPSPHGWYMFFAVLFLFTFALYLRKSRFSTLVIASIFLAFAFATLEFSLELVASIPFAVLCVWLVQGRTFADLKTLLLSMLKVVPVFCLTTFILWPGGWLRGGYLESYGVTGATVLLKNKAAFGEKLTAADLYQKLFPSHEVLLLLFLLCIAGGLYLLLRRRLSAVTIVFCSYTVIAFGLGVADHFRLDTYISETLLFLLVSTVLLLNDGLRLLDGVPRRLAIAAAALVFALAGVQELTARQPAALYNAWLAPILQGVSEEVPAGEKILVNDNWEAYAAYLPGYQFEPTLSRLDVTPRSGDRTQGIRYFLLDSSAPSIPNTKLLRTFPTYIPSHTVSIYMKEQVE